MSLSISRAWDEARVALAQNRRLLSPVALGLVLVPAVVSSMVEPRPVPGEQPEPGGWMWITLAMIIVMLTGQLAIALMTNGWQGSVGGAIGRAVRRLPTLIMSALLIMVPLVLILSVILAMVGLSTGGAGEFTSAALTPTGWLVLLAGLVILLVIGVRLLPLVVIVASGDEGPIDSIKRAFELTRGHFWKLLGFMLLATVAFLIVAAAVGAVFGSLIAFLLGAPEPWSVSLALVALAAGLVQAAFVTIYTAMLARITAQLSARHIHVPDTNRE